MSWIDRPEKGSGWRDRDPTGTIGLSDVWGYGTTLVAANSIGAQNVDDYWQYGLSDSWACDFAVQGVGTNWEDQAQQDTPWSDRA